MSQNALDPNLMTAAERLAEIGEILAAGLLRLLARERETTSRTPDAPAPRHGSPRQRGAA